MGLFGNKNDEEQEQEEEVETYEYSYACDNCNDEELYEIPKGTLITDFLEKADICTNCGCKIYNPSKTIK